MGLLLRYARKEKLEETFLKRYQKAQGIEFVRLAAWMMERIADGTWTEAELRKLFGVTASKFVTMKNKFEKLEQYLSEINAAKGD